MTITSVERHYFTLDEVASFMSGNADPLIRAMISQTYQLNYSIRTHEERPAVREWLRKYTSKMVAVTSYSVEEIHQTHGWFRVSFEDHTEMCGFLRHFRDT